MWPVLAGVHAQTPVSWDLKGHALHHPLAEVVWTAHLLCPAPSCSALLLWDETPVVHDALWLRSADVVRYVPQRQAPGAPHPHAPLGA